MIGPIASATASDTALLFKLGQGLIECQDDMGRPDQGELDMKCCKAWPSFPVMLRSMLAKLRLVSMVNWPRR